ncbi:tRNA uridine-5-carboxymethylaminomethyl(34) synthesis GTPase MnmE, partial [Aliarcobacter butzleri]
LASLSTIYDSRSEIIDEALVICFRAPFSFTGEDVVEFQCHGGVAITTVLVDEVLNAGAGLADPGGFSNRAFLNTKI